MKIKLLECVAIDGTPTMPGTVVDVSEKDAASLLSRRMAEQIEDGPAPTEEDTFPEEAPQPKRKNRK